MTFRDDHDAALARANALEDEVERTKRQRDELAAKVKELEAKAKEPSESKPSKEQRRKERREQQQREKAQRESESSTDSDRETKSDKIAMLSVVGITVAVFGGFMFFGMNRSCNHEKEHAVWKAASDARHAHRDRWNALISVEHCVRRIAWDSMTARRHTPDKEDPRAKYIWSSFTDGIVGNCLEGSKTLLGDAKTPVAIKTALGQWADHQKSIEGPVEKLKAYYGNQDWKEDNFASAPALWKPVLGLLERQLADIAVLRREVFPPIREEIRGYLKAHEAKSGRDEIYWRGALSVALWEINDRSFEASGVYAGREPDQAAGAAAIRPLVEKFLALAKEAPIEVRREVRKIDWITNQVVTGGELIGETPLWHLMMADDEWIGRGQDKVAALPPDPGPEPRDPDNGI